MIVKMPETEYRTSRWFRVMGNPTAYRTVRLLAGRRLTPGDLAREMGRHATTVSEVLRNLRQVDLVRYEGVGRNKFYWLKSEKVSRVLAEMERLVEEMRHLRD